MEFTNPDIFWAQTPEGQRVLKSDDLFDLHYAIYEFSEQESLHKLLSYSFQTAPWSRGNLASSSSPFLALLNQLLDGKYEVYYGQKSMWNAVQRSQSGQQNNVVIFVQILDPMNSNLTTELNSAKELLCSYNSKIHSAMPQLDLKTLTLEFNDYACFIFWNFWAGIPLMQMGPYLFQRPEATVYRRIMTAYALGKRGREGLGGFIKQADAAYKKTADMDQPDNTEAGGLLPV